MDNKEFEKHFNNTILFLAKHTNRDKEFGFDNIIRLLSIPSEYSDAILAKLWHGIKYIDGKPALTNPFIKINDKGIALAFDIEQRIYKETGVVPGVKRINTTFEEACEIIFQKHVSEGGMISWDKSTFIPYPNHLETAKEIMLRKEIIFEGRIQRTTVLSPEYFDAKSYKVAEEIRIANKDTPLAPVTNVTTYGDNSPVSGRDTNSGIVKATGDSIQDSPESLIVALPAEKPINQKSKQQKKITPITIIKSLWHIASTNPLISAIIASIVTALILIYFGIRN